MGRTLRRYPSTIYGNETVVKVNSDQSVLRFVKGCAFEFEDLHISDAIGQAIRFMALVLLFVSSRGPGRG